jgi:hypothetical protein
MTIKEVCRDQKLVKGGADGDTGYHDLNLRSNSTIMPARALSFRVLGFLSAAHLLITGHGPVPLSPALLLFVIGGWDALFDLDLIDLVLPLKASVLRQWPQTYDETIDLSLRGATTSMLIQYLGLTVCDCHRVIDPNGMRADIVYLAC